MKQPQTQRIAPIREIMFQLLQTVKKFTNQLEDKQMEEIKKLLMNLDNRRDIVKVINDAYEDIVKDENRDKANQLREICRLIGKEVSAGRVYNYVQDYDKLAENFFSRRIAIWD